MILTLKNSCVLKIVLFACLINLFVSNEGVSQNAVLLFLFSLASAVNIKLLEAFRGIWLQVQPAEVRLTQNF